MATDPRINEIREALAKASDSHTGWCDFNERAEGDIHYLLEKVEQLESAIAETARATREECASVCERRSRARKLAEIAAMSCDARATVKTSQDAAQVQRESEDVAALLRAMADEAWACAVDIRKGAPIGKAEAP